MTSRVRVLNKHLREFDSKLFCTQSDDTISIFRRGNAYESFQLSDGSILTHVKESPYHILVLTDNWMYSGNPVEWGIEPLMRKLRSMDAWNRDKIRDMEVARAQREKAVERDHKNTHEAIGSELRSEFKRVGDEINFGNKDKKFNY